MTDDRPPTVGRLRRLLLGRRSPQSDTAISTFATVSHYGIGNFTIEPGPFDEPPPEPVELIGEIPWELRDDDTK